MNIKSKDKKEFFSLGDILPNVYKKFKIEEKLNYSAIESAWEDIVGEVIAKHSKPIEFIRGCLIVEVDYPVWLNELNNYSKKDILKRIKNKFKDIKSIKFRIGMIGNGY